MESVASKEYFKFGIEQFDMAKYKDAIDLFLKGIEVDPNDGFCQLYAGITYIFLRDTEKARPFIEKATKLELEPPYGHLLNGIQYFYYEDHTAANVGKAHKHLKNLAWSKYTPEVFLFFYGLADFDYRMYIEEDKDEKKVHYAINYLERAIKKIQIMRFIIMNADVYMCWDFLMKQVTVIII
jgi:tetratricopeptide (TPR) repeat protein